MDEGWTRFVFDHLGIPYRLLRNADVRKGGLEKIADTLLIANLKPYDLRRGKVSRRLPERYRGGLGSEGLDAVQSFVANGGTLVTLNGASRTVLRLWDLPLEEQPGARQMYPEAEDRVDIPGSMLAATVDAGHPLAYGLPRRLPIFFFRSFAFGPKRGAKLDGLGFPLRFAREDLVLGGYAEGADAIGGLGAVLHFRRGKGQVIAFSFSPQFRAQTRGTLPLFLNALLMGGGTAR